MSSPEISVQQLRQLIDQFSADTLQLVDVREQAELEIARLPGFRHYALSDYEQWSGQIPAELDPARPVYVICHHGMRSAQMVGWLQQQGYTQATNIIGGIHAWSVQVDPSLPQY
ncbi:MAG: rhodanese-related sulfurtransferase [Synechococcaceae cyanobacterium SM2_3_2]|nr:rhodanese-related sulfurtransferase [Synechococcaceae cyanobacterium SM2_3_2]